MSRISSAMRRNYNIKNHGGATWSVAKHMLHAELEDAVWRRILSSGFAL